MIEFCDLTEQERDDLDAIVNRGVALFASFGMRVRPIDVRMDIHATHSRYRLDLKDFAAADDFNFSHDLGGIRHHLNRETGELEDCFLPRFARRETTGQKAS